MKKIMVVALVCVLLISLVGCSSDKKAEEKPKEEPAKEAPAKEEPAKEAPAKEETANKDSQVAKIKEKGKIVMGTTADYPPYEFHMSVDGKDTIVGGDVEIAKKIAEELGVELEIVDMDFDGLIPALQAGKVDMVIAGMSETPERSGQVDFSVTYKMVDQTIVIRSEDKDKYKSLEDLKGKAMGGQKGALQEMFIDDEMPDSEKLALGKIPDLILALQAKKIEGVVLENPVAQSYVENNSDLALSGIHLEFAKGSAVVLKKGSSQLLEVINPVVQKLVDSGQVEKWMEEFDKMANEDNKGE